MTCERYAHAICACLPWSCESPWSRASRCGRDRGGARSFPGRTSRNQLNIDAIDLAAVATCANAVTLATGGKLLCERSWIEGGQWRFLLAAPSLVSSIDRAADDFLAGCLAQARQHEP